MPSNHGTLDVPRYISPLMRPPYMKRLSPSLPNGPTFLRRSVVGSISNRGRNYEPARLRSFCGQQNLKSHGQRVGIGGACRCMAAHVQRLPRLTLKAGRRAGCKAGSSVSKEAPFFAGSPAERLSLSGYDVSNVRSCFFLGFVGRLLQCSGRRRLRNWISPRSEWRLPCKRRSCCRPSTRSRGSPRSGSCGSGRTSSRGSGRGRRAACRLQSGPPLAPGIQAMRCTVIARAR
jgi:hypothetical protein